MLPQEYYALTEQHAGRFIPDVLALHISAPEPSAGSSSIPGGLALAHAPPMIQKKITASTSAQVWRRSLAIRHVSGHQLVALIEIVSPSNRDRRDPVDEFATNVTTSLDLGVHVLMIDLFPAGPHDPQGMHGAVWSLLDEGEGYDELMSGEELTLASYVAGPPVDAYLMKLAVGGSLPDMPECH